MSDNRVVCILMERDGIDEQSAIDQVRQCRDEMLESGDEDVIMENLGLNLTISWMFCFVSERRYDGR